MLRFVCRRLLLMVPTLLAVSVISFAIIELPPGDFVTTYVAELQQMGQVLDQGEIENLHTYYGLNQPIYVRYWKWMKNLCRGDLGRSLYWKKPVRTIIVERLPWSFAVALTSLLVVWGIGVPLAMISATRQYSVADYVVTLLGFLGLAIPPFLSALVLLWVYFVYTGNVAVGLFSHEYLLAPWSWAKFADMLKHLWLPALLVGTAGTAGTIRILRANLLDELRKPYVTVARAKGLSECKVLFKYPFRIAINPVVSTIGWILPALVSGELLVSLVLGLPTLAPVFLESLLNQDMFLAGSIVMILSTLTVIGTLISDLLLAWVDPRIRESV